MAGSQYAAGPPKRAGAGKECAAGEGAVAEGVGRAAAPSERAGAGEECAAGEGVVAEGVGVVSVGEAVERVGEGWEFDQSDTGLGNGHRAGRESL